MRRVRFLAALVAALLMPAMALAAAPLNKAGYWTLEAQGQNNCLGAIKARDGAEFMILGTLGELAFGVRGGPLPRGKRGVIATEAYSFDFAPVYSERDGMMYTVKSLTAREVAALRLARELKVSVDGKVLAEVSVEGTGLDAMVDDIAACSNGETGWWGKGAPQTRPQAKPQAKADRPPAAMNAEGVWSLQADEETCSAAAKADGATALVLIATGGEVVAGIATTQPQRRGRKGLFQTDAYSFAFEPRYEDDRTMTVGDVLDSQALFTLRRAKALTISVDGRELVSVDLEASGFGKLMADLLTCARGETGWWGDGAQVAKK